VATIVVVVGRVVVVDPGKIVDCVVVVVDDVEMLLGHQLGNQEHHHPNVNMTNSRNAE